MSQSDYILSARVTGGALYTGNQQFKGNGTQRYCAMCEQHQAQGGGRLAMVQGFKQWVCKLHKLNAH